MLFRSLAANKGWETRRKPERKDERQRELLKRHIQETDNAAKARNNAKLALHMALTQKMSNKRQQRKFVQVLTENLALAERIYQATQNRERQAAYRDRKEQRAIAKADPEAFGESLKKRIKNVFKQDRKKIPELIEKLCIELVEYDMIEEYDENDLWDIYKEAS